MNKYAEIYSEFGLNSMIADTEKELIEKQKEYQDVFDDKRYNPMCRESWLKVIQKDIDDLKKEIEDYKEALLIKQSK